jgi:hypothetical protein
MSISIELLSHERSLLGAIDTFLSSLVHTRPFLAGEYRDALHVFADVWLASDGENDLAALNDARIRDCMALVTPTDHSDQAIAEFTSWAQRTGLLGAGRA